MLFRMSVGRWPGTEERRRFAAGLRGHGAQIPALLRALNAVPAADTQLSNMLIFRLMEQDRLPRTEQGAIAPHTGNALSFWQAPPVSFLHFEKTAGTSLATALSEKCHPLQIHVAPGVIESLLAAPDVPSTDALRDCKLIFGHYDLPTLKRLGPARRIVTILREPRARILSLYYFWRSIHPSLLPEIADIRVHLAHRLDLLAFLNCQDPDLLNSIDNVYVRRLTGTYGGGTPRDELIAAPDSCLAAAMNAAQNLAFVGIMERMAETLRGLSAALGVPLGISLPHENAAAGNAADRPTLYRTAERTAITPAIDSALTHLTRLDTKLFEAFSITQVNRQPEASD